MVYSGKVLSHLRLRQTGGRVEAETGEYDPQGPHIALGAPNSCQWLAFYFGVPKARAVAVTLSNEKLDGLGDRKDRPYLEDEEVVREI